MIYVKLSIRNARRSLGNYLLYIGTRIVLLGVMEVSNCVAIMGELAGFQTISLPLLITVIQVVLIGYIDEFMLKQRAKEFASYLLLGIGKKKLANLYLCEILLIGVLCFLAGTTIGFLAYGFLGFHTALHEIKWYVFLYGKSMLYTFCYFCLVEIICGFGLKKRFEKLQIRELMYEKSRNQYMKKKVHYKKWGMIFLFSFICMTGCVCGIVFLPEDYIVYAVAFVAIPLLMAVVAFYEWIFSFLHAHRRTKSIYLFQQNRLYIMAGMTSDFKTAAIINAVFCMCFLFSAAAFVTGRMMLQPGFCFFDTQTCAGEAGHLGCAGSLPCLKADWLLPALAHSCPQGAGSLLCLKADWQQWMGIAQICICIIFSTIYFSMLSLQKIIELRQDSKNNQILHYLGKSSRQIEALVKQLIIIKLTMPMIMALLVFLICLPLLNIKMNLVLPAAMHNVIFKFAGEYFLCVGFFYSCCFLMIKVMGRQYYR